MGLIDYIRVLWKDYSDTSTPLSAANLNIMDKGIKDLDDTLGDLLGSTDISSIGDGTLTNAVYTINEDIEDANEILAKNIIASTSSSKTVTFDITTKTNITFALLDSSNQLQNIKTVPTCLFTAGLATINMGATVPVIGNGKTLGLTTGSDIGYPFTQTYGGTYPIETISGTPPTAGTSMSDTHSSWSYRKTLGLSKTASTSGVVAKPGNATGTYITYSDGTFTLSTSEGTLYMIA